MHTDDALSGLGVAFAPPEDLCRPVLARQFPDAAAAGGAWPGLLAATGRLAPLSSHALTPARQTR